MENWIFRLKYIKVWKEILYVTLAKIEIHRFFIRWPTCFLGLITSDWLHIHTRQGRRHMTWEQWHVFHSNQENLFTLYLNLGSREVLVNNWREAGVHSRTSPNKPDYPLLQSCPIQVGFLYRILYSVHCKLYTVNCKLYTVHFTLYTI